MAQFQAFEDVAGLGRLADQIRANRIEGQQAPARAAQTELLQGKVQQQRLGLAKLASDRQAQQDLQTHLQTSLEADPNADIDRLSLDYFRKTNQGKAQKFEQTIFDKAVQIGKLDPQGGIDFLNQKTGSTFKLDPAKDGFGKPFAAVGPGGENVFTQINKAGETRIVPGISPPVKKGQTIRSLPGGGFEVISGDGGGTSKKFSEVQAKTGGFATRIDSSNAIGFELEDNPDFDPTSISQALRGATPLLGNLLVSADQQVYNQAKEDWVSANLRLESGAVISDSEFDREDKKWFPQPGDGPRVIANKRNARKRQFQVLKSNSGGSYQAIKKAIVISEHPTLGDISEEEILETMKKHKMTRQAVMERLQGEGDR